MFDYNFMFLLLRGERSKENKMEQRNFPTKVSLGISVPSLSFAVVISCYCGMVTTDDLFIALYVILFYYFLVFN